MDLILSSLYPVPITSLLQSTQISVQGCLKTTHVTDQVQAKGQE